MEANLVIAQSESAATEAISDASELKSHAAAFCESCRRYFNSEKQLQSHWKGMQHAYQLKSLGQPLPADIDSKKLELYIDKLNNPGGVEQSTVRRGHKKKTVAPNLAQRATKVRCDACDLTLNSEKQAAFHFNGRQHKMKMIGPTQQIRPNRTLLPNPPRPSLQPRMFGSADGYSGLPPPTLQYNYHHQQQLPEMTRPPLRHFVGTRPRFARPIQNYKCDCCRQTFNSQSQALAHFQSKRHQKNILLTMLPNYNIGATNNLLAAMPQLNTKKSKGKSSSKLLCALCQVTVNSVSQMEAHVNGGTHKNKMNKEKPTGQVTNDQPTVDGTINGLPAGTNEPTATTQLSTTTTHSLTGDDSLSLSHGQQFSS